MALPTKRSEEIKRQYHQQRSDRGNFESYWRDVSLVCCPDYDQFFQTGSTSTQGEQRYQYQYDATASLAVNYYTSIIESMTMPRGQKYHGLSHLRDDVARDYEARAFFDWLNGLLFTERYRPSSGFSEQLKPLLKSYALFGNACLYADRRGRHNRYKSCYIGDTYFIANFQGIIDGVIRRFSFTHQQAVQMWQGDAPEEARRMLDQYPQATSEYLHSVQPNPDYEPGSLRPDRRRFLEVYVHESTGEELEVGGYDAFPFAIARDIVYPNEIYGRSPAMMMLPHIKVLQEMSRLDLKGWELERLPPLLAADDSAFGGLTQVDMRSGGITWGGISSTGQQMVQPLRAAGQMTPVGDKRMDQERAVIRSAFFVDLYQILVQTPNMTATEAMIRAQEKAGLLVPAIAPIQDTFIGGLVTRDLDIAENSGLIPPERVPGILQATSERGELDIEVTYDAPINRLAKQAEIDGMRAMIDEAIQIDGVMGKPDAILNLDTEFYQREAARQRGVPTRFVKSQQQIQQRRRTEQQQEQAQRLATTAPDAARAAKDFAQAQQIAQGGQ